MISPAAPTLWTFVVIAALLLNALIHAYFVKPVNPKPVVLAVWIPKTPPYLGFSIETLQRGTVIHHYYDHYSQQYRRQTLSQEEMMRRYVSHIPARHFKMTCYYGF